MSAHDSPRPHASIDHCHGRLFGNFNYGATCKVTRALRLRKDSALGHDCYKPSSPEIKFWHCIRKRNSVIPYFEFVD